MNVEFSRIKFSDQEHDHLREVYSFLINAYQEVYEIITDGITVKDSKIPTVTLDCFKLQDAIIQYSYRIKEVSLFPLRNGPSKAKRAAFLSSELANSKPIIIDFGNIDKSTEALRAANEEFCWFVYLSILELDTTKFNIGSIKYSELYGEVKKRVLSNFSNLTAGNPSFQVVGILLISQFGK